MNRSKHNFLRLSRRKTELTQDDICSLLDISQLSTLSRFENAQRRPPIEVLIAYDILCRASLKDLFPHQYQSIKEQIRVKLPELIEGLEQLNLTHQHQEVRLANRISYLQNLKMELEHGS